MCSSMASNRPGPDVPERVEDSDAGEEDGEEDDEGSSSDDSIPLRHVFYRANGSKRRRCALNRVNYRE